MTPNRRAANERRETYLDAAESAFFRLGYEGASMRTIAAEAGVGLGTITYHWQSKEALLNEVFERRLGAILVRQEQGLIECAARYERHEALDLKDIVTALVHPIFVTPFKDPEAIDRAHHLFSFLMTEPSETVLAFNRKAFGSTGDVFYALLQKIGGAYEPETLHWLFACVVGSQILPLSLAERNTPVTGQPQAQPDWEKVSETVTCFIVRGLSIQA